MKTSTLPLLAFVAVIAAIALFPVSVGAAGIAVSVTGIASVLAADYGRNLNPLRSQSQVVPFDAPRFRSRELREAA